MKRLTVLLPLMFAIMPLVSGAAQNDVSALKQKAVAGDAAAQVQLGMTYALGVPRDSREAMKWFKMAADQGYADGQFRLGGMYDAGIRPPNPTEAAKWYTLAAKQGYKDAEYRLAVLYDQGRG